MEALTQTLISSSLHGEEANEKAKKLRAEMLVTLQTKIQSCRSVDEIIDVLPFDYRARFREKTLLLASQVDKLLNSQTAYNRLAAAIGKDEVPQRLRVKAPELQFTSEFAASDDVTLKEQRDALKKATGDYQKSVVASIVHSKDAEVKYWEDKCSPDAIAMVFADCAEETWAEYEKTYKFPTLVTKDGQTSIGTWVTSPQRTAELFAVKRCGAAIRAQILHMAKLRHNVMAKKIEKKKEVAEKAAKPATDVEMADATKPGPSLQSLIDKAINGRLKKLNLRQGDKKVRSHLPPPSNANMYFTAAEYVWPEEAAKLDSTHVDFSSRFLQEAETFETFQGREEGENEEEGEGQAGQEGRRSQREEESRLIAGKSSDFSFFGKQSYNSIPDQVLTMPWDNAISYVLAHTPISILEAGLYRAPVHTSNGLVVPPHIANELSLGLKYMFFSQPSTSVIHEAWTEFVHRLRWRIFFMLRERPDKPFDPDYAVKSSKKVKPPKLPLFMELGLVMGRRYIYKAIANIPDSTITEMRKQPFSPVIPELLKFLLDNNLVITMTDKNLGLAVSERDWLRSNELKLLQDTRNYRRLSKIDADAIMKKKILDMEELSDSVIDHIQLSELGLWEFFRSKVSGPEDDIIYPQFHGIPKIHKTPTGFRPIIPCHSVCFNPAAKFISKELKPIIREVPTIIHGTKDLFMKLSQLSIDSSRKWFFVTGDVVAFYPNIPLGSCINIVNSMYEDYMLNRAPATTSFLGREERRQLDVQMQIFQRAIEIGNTKLITQHGKDFYLQLNGLAMGVADSPDLANLFGAHFELRSQILAHDDVAFYGRYIDDCFSIVYADNADEALELVRNKIIFDGCVIEWAVSADGCQFLDAFIYKSSSKLEWRPYVKSGNNRERIPWVTHHPLDVKRGVYIGELSRLAVLCSKLDIYIGAIKDLNALYLKRGYPLELVMTWCRKNIRTRWENRFTSREAEHDEGVLVLKSRFNDVWNWFSAAELGKTVTEYWSEWYTRAELGRFLGDPSRPFPAYRNEESHGIDDVDRRNLTEVSDGEEGTIWVPDLRKIGLLGRRWIVSRKRTTNLFDLSSQWKKTVFRKLDEAIAEDGGANITNLSLDDSLFAAHMKNTGSVTYDSDTEIGPSHRRSPEQDTWIPEFGRASKRTN